MIVFIIILNLIISLGVLFLIKKGAIIKYSCFLKYVNITQVISILLFVSISFCKFVDDRLSAIYLFFIYVLLSIIVFIVNAVILLINFSRKQYFFSPTSHNKINKDNANISAGKLAKEAAKKHSTKILEEVK
jgi:hypothetical protein